MDSLLGFDYAPDNEGVEGKFHNTKLVPWISWDEWKFVKESLFSSSVDSIASAVHRIRTWQSRGCIPVLVEVTASFIEIQQRDPFFRDDLDGSVSSCEELAMLYCMAIMRLVNGVVEKTRRKNQVSIGEAADAISIPRMLIDIRHEGSHRGLPSLRLLQLASQKALEWLIWYYWDPQEKMIASPNDAAANLKKEINSRIVEAALCVKGKCPKKQVAKSLKNVLRLYSSSSPEVVHAVLDFLLSALDSHDSEKQTAFEDWNSVVMKLSHKNSEFLLSLTQSVVEKLERNEVEIDGKTSSVVSFQTKSLSFLLDWLSGNLKKLMESPEKHFSKSTVLGLLRRCLLACSPPNRQVLSSAITLAQLNGDASLVQKLQKLASLHQPHVSGADSAIDTHLGQEDSLLSLALAKEKLQSITRRKNNHQALGDEPVKTSRWAVAESWQPCPIGMLPHHVGCSGRLPALDYHDGAPMEPGRRKKTGKREAASGNAESVSAKKMKGRGAYCSGDAAGGVDNDKGLSMNDGGVWRSVGEEELLAIASTVRLLLPEIDD